MIAAGVSVVVSQSKSIEVVLRAKATGSDVAAWPAEVLVSPTLSSAPSEAGGVGADATVLGSVTAGLVVLEFPSTRNSPTTISTAAVPRKTTPRGIRSRRRWVFMAGLRAG
ncbi:hypothetical protein GCM10027063_39800 [Promicromonospora xylanilytica]